MGVRREVSKTKEQVRINFEGALLEKFKQLKEHYCIYNNTDLIRFLIAKEYERLKEEGKL